MPPNRQGSWAPADRISGSPCVLVPRRPDPGISRLFPDDPVVLEIVFRIIVERARHRHIPTRVLAERPVPKGTGLSTVAHALAPWRVTPTGPLGERIVRPAGLLWGIPGFRSIAADRRVPATRREAYG